MLCPVSGGGLHGSEPLAFFVVPLFGLVGVVASLFGVFAPGDRGYRTLAVLGFVFSLPPAGLVIAFSWAVD